MSSKHSLPMEFTKETKKRTKRRSRLIHAKHVFVEPNNIEIVSAFVHIANSRASVELMLFCGSRLVILNFVQCTFAHTRI